MNQLTAEQQKQIAPVRKVMCPRCGFRHTLDGVLAVSPNTVYVRCACGGTAVVRPNGARGGWNGQV